MMAVEMPRLDKMLQEEMPTDRGRERERERQGLEKQKLPLGTESVIR